MILLIGIIAGIVALFVRSKISGRRIEPLNLQGWWLVLVAFIPQFLAFGPPARWLKLPDGWVSVLLVVSQLILLVFAWQNRKKPGGWLLGAGLLMNFLVIFTNGGMMPINPETVHRLVPNAPTGSWQIGERLGRTKDIVLLESQTRFSFLSDRFLLPAWLNYPVAFSLGDVFIALGAFWLVTSMVEEK
jgi:hypothetical protein